MLHGGVVVNHVVELVVPFGFFPPQPVCGIAGLITIAFQLTLIVSGNLSWLNWLTIVLAFTTLDDRWLSWLPVSTPTLQPIPAVHRYRRLGAGGRRRRSEHRADAEHALVAADDEHARSTRCSS